MSAKLQPTLRDPFLLPVCDCGGPMNLASLEPHVRLATGPDAFVAAVRSALAAGAAGAEERIALAARSTWDDRTDRLLGLVDEELGRECGS